MISPYIALQNLHCLEWQSERVKVVEGVGLVASSFQFFSRLGSMFAEEFGDLFCNPKSQLIQRRKTFLAICINIRLIIQGRLLT